MRLSAKEQSALEYAIEGIEGEIFLYGSRTNPQARGGDIDILILSSSSSYELSKKVSTRFFSRLEQKVDVTVYNPQKMSAGERAFFESVNKERIR
jgi:uncharacterized protein